MKRGDQARESVKNTIIEAFSKDGNYVTFQDKKIYVTAKDGPGGEILQFAISFTMPKVPVQATSNTDWREDSKSSNEQPSKGPVSLSPEDEQAVRDLMKKLGVEDEL